ncbi:MAG: glycosyltransferase [bacterium]|nr:glycosyltransferase [bacterium]
MPRVSVVMASYNHEKYVAEAIQSALDQTYQDIEIIITDDGSTDGTVSQIKKFRDPRISLFCFEKNQGACVAIRTSLEKARGEYIALLNSDDVFYPDKLEKQVSFLNDHSDIAAVFSHAQIIDEQGNDFVDVNHFYYSIFQQANRTRFEWLNHFFYHRNCLCHPSVLIRRKCYETIGYYDERYAQLPDFDFWIRLCMHYEIHVLQEKLIKFRIRTDEANASGNRPEVRIRDRWEFGQILKNYLRIKTCEDLLKIFPEAAEYQKIDENLIPFYVAMIALKVNSPIYQLFAVNTLHELLGNRKIAEKLETRYNFRYIDLIRLTGRYDFFNLERGEIEKSKEERERERLVKNKGIFKTIFKSLNFHRKNTKSRG